MKRLITGLLVFLGWFSLVYFGVFHLFWLVVSAIGALALHEYGTIVLPGQSSSVRFDGLFCGMLPYLVAFSGNFEAVAASVPLAFIVLVGFIVLRYPELDDPLLVLSRSAFGIVYIGFFGATLILLRYEPAGVAWLLWLTGIIVGSDSCAYYVGGLLGKRKLCPAVSPGKTVAGFFGGLVGSVIISVLLAEYLFVDHDPVVMGVAAAFLCCVGVLGDLCESVIKRSMSVKDSGSILPGHGGVMDRIDSLIFTAPVLFCLVRFGFMVP